MTEIDRQDGGGRCHADLGQMLGEPHVGGLPV